MYNVANITIFFHFYYILIQHFTKIKVNSKMYKYLLQTLLFSIFLGAFFPNTVLAIDYTTKNSQNKCTNQDLREIKRFDIKARKKVKKFEEIKATDAQIRTYKDALKFGKAMAKIRKFFESDKYKAMKIIYKKCGEEIPSPKNKPLFWIPDGDQKEVPTF